MVAEIKKLDNAVAVLKSMPDVDYYERIGSLVYHALNQFYIPTEEAKAIFQGTILEEFIEAPEWNQVITAFMSECKRILNPIYEGKLKSFPQEISKGSGMFYIVFFTGNVKEKNDETKFSECAKFMTDGEGNIALLNCDEQWQIKTSEEISTIWQRCQMWSKAQLSKALNSALKKHGYKFGSGEGSGTKQITFLPIALTDEFYKLRSIVKTLNNSSLSIAPVIAGSREDAEEYKKIVTDSFESEFMEGKKALFELCLHLYSQQKEWENYISLVRKRDIETLKLTHIATSTRYGQQLTSKLQIINNNACNAEWEEICNEWVYSVKACQRVYPQRVYNIQATLKNALDKINSAVQTRYLAAIKDDIEKDILVTAKILAKVSEQTIDNVLRII